MEIPQGNATKEFVVLNNASRVANFVQIVENSENGGGLLYCQCIGAESGKLNWILSYLSNCSEFVRTCFGGCIEAFGHC